MKAWLMEWGSAKDEIPALEVPMFLIYLEDGDTVAAQIYFGGEGGDSLTVAISECARVSSMTWPAAFKVGTSKRFYTMATNFPNLSGTGDWEKRETWLTA